MSSPDRTARRLGRGRYEIDGRRVESVTWVKGEGIPKPNLIDWAARVTIEYCEDYWDDLVALEKSSERRHRLERARYEQRDAAANKGTEVHKLAMRLAAGEEVDVPEVLSGHVDAYLSFVNDWEPHELLVETPVFNRALMYAGTPDLYAQLADGHVWLLDWKTAGKGIFPDDAVQLAAYAHAEFWVDEKGKEQPLPAIDRAGAVWLRSDGYDIYPVDISERTFRLWRYARELARFKKDSPVGPAWEQEIVGDALEPPRREAAA